MSERRLLGGYGSAEISKVNVSIGEKVLNTHAPITTSPRVEIINGCESRWMNYVDAASEWLGHIPFPEYIPERLIYKKTSTEPIEIDGKRDIIPVSRTAAAGSINLKASAMRALIRQAKDGDHSKKIKFKDGDIVPKYIYVDGRYKIYQEHEQKVPHQKSSVQLVRIGDVASDRLKLFRPISSVATNVIGKWYDGQIDIKFLSDFDGPLQKVDEFQFYRSERKVNMTPLVDVLSHLSKQAGIDRDNYIYGIIGTDMLPFLRIDEIARGISNVIAEERINQLGLLFVSHGNGLDSRSYVRSLQNKLSQDISDHVSTRLVLDQQDAREAVRSIFT